MRKLAICFALILSAAPARAQSNGSVSDDSSAIDDARTNARVHVGAFYLTPQLVLKQIGVDSNVFNQTVDPKSDFTLTVAPTATMWVPMSHRALFKVAGATDLVYFAKYDSERSIDPQFSARGEVYLNHLTLYGQDSFISSRQRPSFEIDLRSRRNDNLAMGGAIWNVTPRFAVDTAIRRHILRYDADAYFEGSSLRDALNHDTTALSVTPKYKLSPLTVLAVRVDRAQERFEIAPARDNDTWRVMPGVEFKPRALVSGSAYVGRTRLTPLHADLLPGFQGLVADLDLSYTLLGSTTFGVNFDRDLQYSLEDLQPYYVNTGVGASVRHAIGGRFDVLGTANRYQYDFQALTGPLGVQKNRVDHIRVYSATLGYRLAQTGRLGFGAWYTTRESTRPGLAYDGLRLGTTMTYGF